MLMLRESYKTKQLEKRGESRGGIGSRTIFVVLFNVSVTRDNEDRSSGGGWTERGGNSRDETDRDKQIRELVTKQEHRKRVGIWRNVVVEGFIKCASCQNVRAYNVESQTKTGMREQRGGG